MIPAPISAFFAPVAVRIMAAVIAVLLVLLAVAMWRADGLSKDKRDLQDDLATEQVQHLVTTASVDRLTGELETMMASALARQKQLDASREQVERTLPNWWRWSGGPTQRSLGCARWRTSRVRNHVRCRRSCCAN